MVDTSYSATLRFASVILAFAQPYIAETTKNQKQNTIIYIDNSMSMSAKVGSYELLKKCVSKNH